MKDCPWIDAATSDNHTTPKRPNPTHILHQSPDTMDQSQSPENPLDVTAEMMSQTTANLLANLAMDVSLNASGASNNNTDSRMRPLHAIHNAHGTSSSNNITRTMGPNEILYRTKHDGFVTKTIRSYAAGGGVKLPKYRQMNEDQRKEAMTEMDALLERLSCGSAKSAAASVNVQRGHETNAADETLGSATTMGEHNETFGSATTLGENQSVSLLTANKTRLNQSTGSATTMGEGLKSLATLNQSVSLLEESMVLLSEDEEEDNMETAVVDDDAESRFSTGHSPISPIERTRHASIPLESTLFQAELSPAFSTYRPNSKRCASNSGKRGLKSRVRLDESDDAESSLLKHFEGNEDMFCEEDAFSCGSPIQRRFSCDLDDGNEGGEFKDDRQREEEEEVSRFSLQEDIDFGNNGHDDDEEGVVETQRAGYQQSQWSTFQNADPKLTYPEGDEEDDSPVRRRLIRFDGNSQRPTTSRKHQSLKRQQNPTVDEEANEIEEEVSLEEKMADMGVDDVGNNSGDDDHIQTVKNLSRRAKALESQGVDSSLLDEVAPTDIRLRDGAHFRMDPLRCRQTKDKARSKSTKKQPKSVRIQHPKAKSKVAAAKHYESESENELSDPDPSFTDPISRFPTRVASRLNGAYDFIMSKEERDTNQPVDISSSLKESCGVLLSMPIDQCVSITSKLLIQTIKSSRTHQRSMNGLKKSKGYTPNVQLIQEKDVLAGGTLIVLRDKADFPQWEVALREYTSLSVMNHAEMQSSLRKLANTAAKCAGFDVVLSTYDAIKAKEVTVPVDENGRAMLEADSSEANEDGGWLTSRVAGSQTGGQAPRKCHQLSVLHRMSWYRVIMLDVLGRKGFLTKPGTARVQAAVAINANSRFVLFEKEDEATGKPTEKFKDDRRQLRSVTTALQLPTTLKLDKFINSYVLDVNKVCRGNDAQLKDESSSELEESFEEEYSSDDENLTEPYSY